MSNMIIPIDENLKKQFKRACFRLEKSMAERIRELIKKDVENELTKVPD